MPLKLITYDLNQEVKRPPIVKAIKDDFDGWARLSESSYAVRTTLSAAQVHQKLAALIDDNDQLYVIPLSSPYSGFGPKDVNDFLDRYL